MMNSEIGFDESITAYELENRQNDNSETIFKEENIRSFHFTKIINYYEHFEDFKVMVNKERLRESGDS